MSYNADIEHLKAIFAGIDIEIPPDPLDTLTEALGLREVTTEELATVLGLTVRRVAQLSQEGHIPEPHKDGNRYLFPLLASVRQYIDFKTR